MSCIVFQFEIGFHHVLILPLLARLPNAKLTGCATVCAILVKRLVLPYRSSWVVMALPIPSISV
jgi:hypothetical protein